MAKAEAVSKPKPEAGAVGVGCEAALGEPGAGGPLAGLTGAQARDAANAGAARYREMIDTYADMPTMEVWYSNVSFAHIREQVQSDRRLMRIIDAVSNAPSAARPSMSTARSRPR